MQFILKHRLEHSVLCFQSFHIKSYSAFASFSFILSIIYAFSWLGNRSQWKTWFWGRMNRKYMYLINFFSAHLCVFAPHSLPFYPHFLASADVEFDEFFFVLAPAHFADLPIYRILSHISLPKSKAIAIQLFITHFILQNQNIHIHGTLEVHTMFFYMRQHVRPFLGMCALNRKHSIV